MTARKDLGFTLIEVVVVVLIIGVLAALAFPSYTGMMQRTRRAEAVTIISDQQLRLEKHRVDNPSYETYNDLPAAAKGVTSTAYYDVEVTDADEDSYTITAEALGVQASDPCGDLAVTFDAGEVTKTPDPTSTDCW